jgi:hypothetical protein
LLPFFAFFDFISTSGSFSSSSSGNRLFSPLIATFHNQIEFQELLNDQTHLLTLTTPFGLTDRALFHSLSLPLMAKFDKSSPSSTQLSHEYPWVVWLDIPDDPNVCLLDIHGLSK